MNSQWYTTEGDTEGDTEGSPSCTTGSPVSDAQPQTLWIRRWWPGLVLVATAIAAVALLAVLLPKGSDAVGSMINETPDRPGEEVSIPDGDRETGERVVEGTQAPVGGGRDTRLVAGHVTVLVPDSSVAGEGTLHVQPVESTAPPKGLSQVAEAVELDLEGTEQVGAFTMETALAAEVGARSFQATHTDSGGCCEVPSGQWDPERDVFVSRVEEPSIESFFSIPTDTLEDFAKRLIGDRFSDRLLVPDQPDCPHETYPEATNWGITSDGDDSIRWCLEELDAGGPLLKIRNLNPHAVMLGYPGGFPKLSLGVPYPLSSLLTTTSEFVAPVGARMVVLQRGDIAIADLSSAPEDFEALLTASSNVVAWGGDFFDVALDVLVGAYASIPSWARPTEMALLGDRAAALGSIDGSSCIQDVAQGEELTSAEHHVWSELADRLASCLENWVTDQGSPTWMRHALQDVSRVAVRAMTTLLSSDSLVTDGADHRIMLQRLPAEGEPGVTPPATTTPAPKPTAAPTRCPNLALGSWKGRWTSNGQGSGEFDATIRTAQPEITGILAIDGSTNGLGGTLTGQVRCERVNFGRVDQEVEFNGRLSEDGRSMTGTYTFHSDGTRLNAGSFTATLRR